jgi:hypothetical protein
MANNLRVHRPASVIKANITPISNELKSKVSVAFSEIVSKIKAKHLN